MGPTIRCLMKFHRNPKNSGFTLVELLVVIVIVGALAALSLTVGPKMMAKAKATESMQNIRQIGPLLVNYAADHSMVLPAINGPVTREDGTTADTQWNEICLAMLFPETNPDEFKTQEWWKNNKTFLRNPLFKETSTPRGWEPLNPGYALNEMIAENLALATGNPVPGHEELLAMKVPLAALAEPNRTPLIAPFDNYYYRYDEAEAAGFTSGALKDLMTEGKVPVLFVDGHLETMSPTEYVERKLYLVPIAPVE
jgi:prepilin-type N-terminal cleavage/methylation domain-containing protein/prepilin-type processing-associated H-X9-DG protein